MRYLTRKKPPTTSPMISNKSASTVMPRRVFAVAIPGMKRLHVVRALYPVGLRETSCPP